MNAPLRSLTVEAGTTGEAYLRLLADRGIDYLFANAGTDFAPLIEAFARCAAHGLPVPRPVTVPHENVAVGMALGYWLISRRMQAVMVHVSVGTANTLCGILNAARARVPLLLSAGRTPITESGVEGTRDVHIHWPQEMYDQAGMLREMVKWDYELRSVAQLETVVDRALNVAQAAPAGPVYLTLPREVLAARLERPIEFRSAARRVPPVPPGPDAEAVEQAARWIAAARMPVIITSGLGLERGAAAALAEVSERFALPVVQHVPRCMSLPTDHPMHAGFDPDPWLAEADVVLVVESAVPWMPSRAAPRAEAKVVQVGVDPLHAETPIRGYECDLGITSAAGPMLRALGDALSPLPAPGVETRRRQVAAARDARDARAREALGRARTATPIDSVWLTHCVGEACDANTVVIREAPQFAFAHFPLRHEHAFYSMGAAGGLGWGLGAAVGAKMAAPDSTVILVTGDGSYMFGVPVAAHYAALEQDAPFLTVIVNNRRWNEVGVATRKLYPDGYAARDRAREPLTYFDERLALAKVVEAVGGHGERITDPAALPEALKRALRIVREERRQAVLEVICA